MSTSISTIPTVACGTDGCTSTGHGISIAVSRPGSVLRPDLPDDEQPRYGSVHAAADSLISWTADRDPVTGTVVPDRS